MLIPLADWAARRYAVPPSIPTLRRWVREGQIHPAPQRAGKNMYHVDEHAVKLEPGARPSLVERIKMMEAA